MNDTIKKWLRTIFKIAIVLTIIFVIIVIIIGAYEYYEDIEDKKEKDKKTERVLQLYKNNWIENSIHECQLKTIEYRNTTKDYIVTDSNRNKFKNGILTLIINKDKLKIKNKYNAIVATQTEWIGKTKRKNLSNLDNFRDYTHYLGSYNLESNKYGYENIRYILTLGSLYIEDESDIKYYNCEKIK